MNQFREFPWLKCCWKFFIHICGSLESTEFSLPLKILEPGINSLIIFSWRLEQLIKFSIAFSEALNRIWMKIDSSSLYMHLKCKLKAKLMLESCTRYRCTLLAVLTVRIPIWKVQKQKYGEYLKDKLKHTYYLIVCLWLLFFVVHSKWMKNPWMITGMNRIACLCMKIVAIVRMYTLYMIQNWHTKYMSSKKAAQSHWLLWLW